MKVEVTGKTVVTYKDIDQVIALESDLVKVKTKLKPLAVIKG